MEAALGALVRKVVGEHHERWELQDALDGWQAA